MKSRDWKTFKAREKASKEDQGALYLYSAIRAVSRKILRWEARSVRTFGGKRKPLLVAILDCGHEQFFTGCPSPQPETWGCLKCVSDPPREGLLEAARSKHK